MNEKGMVYLIGAGPGDPDLITLKGQKCMQKADVVIYDYLAAPQHLAFSPENAEKIYVGKKGGDHTLSQEGINALLVEKANQGHCVARLKGGDPFIFGRGGEEIEALLAENISFEVVPGVTSPIAATAYAGIPLTHRRFTSSVAFITGHEDPTKKESSINWSALAEGIGTLVFLMGIKNLPNIRDNLVNAGKSPQTPTAVVRWGTTPRQKTVQGTLATIHEKVLAAGIKAPAIIVVGEVVQLREQMRWFENRPLLGKRMVITRSRAQASNLVEQLEAHGTDCMVCPMINIIPPDDFSPLDTAIGNLSDYDWIIFTSVNGVDSFFERLFAAGLDARVIGSVQIAVIGPATRDRLRCFGINSDILPDSYRAESVVEAFQNVNMKGKKVLLPRARKARPVIPVELSKMEAIVDEIACYQTHTVPESKSQLITALTEKKVDLITFTSSSTVENFIEMMSGSDKQALLEGVILASIGPITTQTATEHGLDVQIEAEKFTIEGLVEAILDHYQASND
ncbi:uroporphyrinogen-III C-methyltransferase [Desulfobacterales bacterium HSG17]|nr:uroporphyrinogen-III C-methyltransferase [Desulfobacterales bacterium HSG17]